MFPNATRHRSIPCTKASLEALQEIRIKYRKAIDQENEAGKARTKKRLNLYVLANHDTYTTTGQKSLFLYKNKSKWSKTKQNEPKYYLNCILILKAYDLAQDLRNIFEKKTTDYWTIKISSMA
jgi:hypothetical protein